MWKKVKMFFEATVVIIVVLALVIAGMFVNSWYTRRMAKEQQEQIGIFQQGAQYGYEQAIIQVIQQAVTCQQVPLIVGNQTINMIAVECLQQTE